MSGSSVSSRDKRSIFTQSFLFTRVVATSPSSARSSARAYAASARKYHDETGASSELPSYGSTAAPAARATSRTTRSTAWFMSSFTWDMPSWDMLS